jgi:hypothetical protein
LGGDLWDLTGVVSDGAQCYEEHERTGFDDTFVGGGVGQLDGLRQGLHGDSPSWWVQRKTALSEMDERRGYDRPAGADQSILGFISEIQPLSATADSSMS